MTWLDKIQFWKKEPELPFPEPAAGPGPMEGPPSLDGPPPVSGAEPFGAPRAEPFGQPSAEPMGMPEPRGLPPQPTPVLGVTPKPETGGVEKELQLLNAKLDAIKATVDSINTRLEYKEKPQEKELIQWR